MNDYLTKYLGVFGQLLESTEASDRSEAALSLTAALQHLCDLTEAMKRAGGRLFFAGNGASAAFASHMTLDWSKNGGVPAIALHDPVQLTALGNDLGFEDVFALPLGWHGKDADVLVTISSSGNSPNIVKAIEAARAVGMKVVTLSGLKPDNMSRAMGDLNLYVPAKTYGMVECAHQLFLHAWLDCSMGVREWDRDEIQNMRNDDFQA